MGIHLIFFALFFMCAAAITACGKKVETGSMPENSSALVTIEVGGHDEEHREKNVADKLEHRELGAHVHGAASMNLVLENTMLNISMSVSGMDAVGFEHPAASADEQAILKQALEHFQNPHTLFVFSKNANCTLSVGAVETALLNKNAKPGSHTDVEINYQWRCENPQRLKQISVHLFSYFPHLQKIQANWIASSKQGAMELTKSNAVLSID